MDLNDLRTAVTVLGLLLFVWLAVWTWRPTRLAAHDAAARLPFDEDRGARSGGEGVRDE